MRGTKRKRREGVWELRVYVGRDPGTGNPKQVSKTFHGSAREADEALRDMIEQQVTGRSDGARATVGQLLDAWLSECERMDLSPTTMRSYRAQIERTIRPALGSIKVARLGAKDLDDLYRAIKANGRSPKTIRNHHAILAAALHQAVRWGWVRRNVAEMAKPPRVSQRVVRPPSVEAVRQIVVAAEERDPRVAPLLMLAALTGMRRCELCALRWSDLDPDSGEIEVARSVVLVPGGLGEKTTKTNRTRHVALDEVGLTVLKTHRARVEEWAAWPTRSWPGRLHLLPLRRRLAPVPARQHDELLHQGQGEASRCALTRSQTFHGHPADRCGRRRPHSRRTPRSHRPSMTLRVYSHALEERDRAAAAVMGRLLTPPVSES